jgi:hypothetical protein
MDGYDPLLAPDAEAWLALDESARISAVEAYHEAERFKLPNLRVHATFHVVVETQIAMGDELPVREKVRQLMAQGLDRHDALHAVISVLVTNIFGPMKGKPASPDPNHAYFSALRRLTAQKWRRAR